MPESMFLGGSNHAHSVFEIYDGERLWQWSQLEITETALKRCSYKKTVKL